MADPKIIIATESVVLQKGIRALIDSLGRFDYLYCDDVRRLSRMIDTTDASMVIISSVLFSAPNSYSGFLREHDDDKKRIVLLLVNETMDDLMDVAAVRLSEPEEVFMELFKSKLANENALKVEKESTELSVREKSILREIALGKTSKLIAEELFISAHTVVTHRKNINRKLNIKTASGLTVYAILNNIISVEELEQNQ